MKNRSVSSLIRYALGSLAVGAALTACSEQSPGGTIVDAATAPADLATAPTPDQAQLTMSFFITSDTGTGDLGGLAGADARCQRLAQAVGAGAKKWAAYLSTSAGGGQNAVNARDRIGSGPWYNYNLVLIADSVNALHQANVNINKTTGLDETGKTVPGVGDTPNQHDILTGSDANGMVSGTANCANWTSSAASGVNAMVGHFDRTGGGFTSWNAAHTTPNCSAAGLMQVGGAGRLYCFATN
ncbi:MAG TPA: lectin [Pseudomonadota bacterium]|nr:lectin [Pseudomonadota bacterium]